MTTMTGMRAIAVLVFAGGVLCDPEAEARALLQRILPAGRDMEFDIQVADDASGSDYFTIADASGGRVAITGNTAGSVAWGLNYYLKYHARCAVTWMGDNLALPASLPAVGTAVTKHRNYKYGYKGNVCEQGYTAAWWDWARWEREIDWMAMNGINMPLVFAGQEYVWNATFAEFGVTYEELQDFFAGPAFLAWQRMGNLKAWGGPLPAEWVVSQKDLQLQIVRRCRALGMKTVLPGFAGFLPDAFVAKHNVTHRTAAQWVGFTGKYTGIKLLDPVDPMFREFEAAFIRKQTEIYGTDHLYNIDQFNEMQPTTNDPAYLTNVSKAVVNGLTDADPEAVWVMQGWLFLNAGFWGMDQAKAYLGGVPNDKMIILDLASNQLPQFQRLESYFGKPYIWNMLHDYGGNTEFFGDMGLINSAPYAAGVKNSTIIGYGITPEGTRQNYGLYDLMLEAMWRTEGADLEVWCVDYAHRRYGAARNGTAAAWNLMHPKSGPWGGYPNYHSKVTAFPTLSMYAPGYDKSTVVQALRGLLAEAPALGGVATFRLDVVDFTRQVLADVLSECHTDAAAAFAAKDAAKLAAAAEKALGAIADLDTVLGSEKHFLLGVWLEDAKAQGADPAAKALFEQNARNQVTTWGPKGEINDYAAKQWAGLVKDYYYVRWEMFLQMLQDDLAAQAPYDPSKYLAKVLPFELGWYNRTDTFPTEPSGDSVALATAVVAKYFPSV